jgi:hypothetical protein
MSLFALLLSAGLSCTPENTFTTEPDQPVPEPGYGDVSGRVCDPDGVDWLEGALVYSNLVDATGRFYDLKSTTTDEGGNWLLEELPEGYGHIVQIQKGSEVIETHEIDIFNNERTEIPEPDCFDTNVQDVMLIQGDFDDFRPVLDALGIVADELDGRLADELISFLLDLDAMKEYDLIVFNGGFVEQGVVYNTEDGSDSTPGQILTNLQAYVNEGGSIYSSDWGYDLVEQAWPDAIDFLGTDHVPDDAQVGVAQTVSASIANQVMAEWMGITSMGVSYDLPVWPPIESVSSLTSIHLLSEVAYREEGLDLTLASSPLLVSFNGGGGKVVYSTFRFSANLNSEMVSLMQFVMFEL